LYLDAMIPALFGYKFDIISSYNIDDLEKF